jgi:hypothetical protein
MLTKISLENLRNGKHLGDPEVRDRIILKQISQKYYVEVRPGFNTLRTGFSGGIMRTG